jgi:hypothetical protein
MAGQSKIPCPPQADCRELQFPEGNPILQGSLVQFNDSNHNPDPALITPTVAQDRDFSLFALLPFAFGN